MKAMIIGYLKQRITDGMGGIQKQRGQNFGLFQPPPPWWTVLLNRTY